MTPTPKVTAVGAAGALATVLTFLLQWFNVDVPPEVLVPGTALLTFGFGWLRGENDAAGAHAA
jgi:hypothetical protein